MFPLHESGLDQSYPDDPLQCKEMFSVPLSSFSDPSLSLIPSESFAQTQRNEDERFFQVFPDARIAATSRNQLILTQVNDYVQFQGTYAFLYDNAANPYRGTFKNCCPPSVDSYGPVSSLELPPPADIRRDYLHTAVEHPNPTAVSSGLSPTSSEISSSPYGYSGYYYGETPAANVVHEQLDDGQVQPFAVQQPLLDPPNPYALPTCSFSPKEEPLMDFLPLPEPLQSPQAVAQSYMLPEHSSSHPAPGNEKSECHSPVPSSTSRPPRSTRDHTHPRSLRGVGSRSPPPASHKRSSASRQQEKKTLGLACYFCRHRKIACGAPEPDNPDRTCNQCLRRSLKCEYPLESRRGMRRRKPNPEETSISIVASGSSKS